MKIRYWFTLAATFILSLGLVTSCATPEGGNPDAGGAGTEPGVVEPADPGAAPADPNAAPAEGQ